MEGKGKKGDMASFPLSAARAQAQLTLGLGFPSTPQIPSNSITLLKVTPKCSPSSSTFRFTHFFALFFFSFCIYFFGRFFYAFARILHFGFWVSIFSLPSTEMFEFFFLNFKIYVKVDTPVYF